MKKTNIFKNLIGETLLEVLIAVTALMITGVGTSAMLIASMKTTGISRDYLVGHNLAVEAVEGVKNILATNELQHPNSLDWDCWKQVAPDPLNTSVDCRGENPGEGPQDPAAIMQPNTYYRIYPETTGSGEITRKWKMEQETVDLKLATSLSAVAAYKLDKIQLGPTCVYTHEIGSACTSTSSVKDFYRQVSVYGIDDTDHSIDAEIIVRWEDGGKISTYSTGIIKIT